MTYEQLLRQLNDEKMLFYRIDVLGCMMQIPPGKTKSVKTDDVPWVKGNTKCKIYSVQKTEHHVILKNHMTYCGEIDFSHEQATITADKPFMCVLSPIRCLLPTVGNKTVAPLSFLMTAGLNHLYLPLSRKNLKLCEKQARLHHNFRSYEPLVWFKNTHHACFYLDVPETVQEKTKQFFASFTEALKEAERIQIIYGRHRNDITIYHLHCSCGCLRGTALVKGRNREYSIFSNAAEVLLAAENSKLSEFISEDRMAQRLRNASQPKLDSPLQEYDQEYLYGFLDYCMEWVQSQWKSFLAKQGISVGMRFAPVRMFLTFIRNEMAYIPYEEYGFPLHMPVSDNLEQLLNQFCLSLVCRDHPVFMSWEWTEN